MGQLCRKMIFVACQSGVKNLFAMNADTEGYVILAILAAVIVSVNLWHAQFKRSEHARRMKMTVEELEKFESEDWCDRHW